MTKKLGKIISVDYGFFDYTENKIGLNLVLGANHGWETTWFENNPDTIKMLLIDAKVQNVSKLLNKPIEATIEDGMLRDFRILKEVI